MDLRYEKIRSYIVQRPSVKAGGFFYIDFQDTKDTTATFKNQFILFLKGAPGIKQSGLRKTALRSRQSILWIFSTVQSRFFRLWSSRLAAVFAYGAALTCSKVTATTTPVRSRRASSSSWLIKGNKKKGKAQSRRYQRQATRINCDYTRLVL